MEKIDLVAIDIDGTLIDDHLKVSENTIDIIKDLKRRDIEVSLVSGRAHAAAKLIMDQIGIELPIISHNGGKVTLEDGRIIRNEKFPISHIKEVLHYAERNNLFIKAYIDDLFYVTYDSERNKEFSKRFGVDYKIIEDPHKDIIEDINLLLLYFEKEITMNEINKFQGLDVEITTSIPHALEFIPKGISKAEGLKDLKKHLNIKRENILAIGNSLNDLSMLEFAGSGIAMKNSDPLLLEHFQNMSRFTNNEEGVYHILKEIIV